ncbi:unnamed protein product [Hydatigera taeniaeformis]|uniref:Uncharacterized protein n=1 Tax=Hydatigena taeniaeformis TaxID=6205 RepID=A0A0R3WYF4_HYDTA|nr:unnamed protein product [Hydatigera taeniaeformis]
MTWKGITVATLNLPHHPTYASGNNAEQQVLTPVSADNVILSSPSVSISLEEATALSTSLAPSPTNLVLFSPNKHRRRGRLRSVRVAEESARPANNCAATSSTAPPLDAAFDTSIASDLSSATARLIASFTVARAIASSRLSFSFASRLKRHAS